MEGLISVAYRGRGSSQRLDGSGVAHLIDRLVAFLDSGNLDMDLGGLSSPVLDWRTLFCLDCSIVGADSMHSVNFFALLQGRKRPQSTRTVHVCQLWSKEWPPTARTLNARQLESCREVEIRGLSLIRLPKRNMSLHTAAVLAADKHPSLFRATQAQRV